MEYTNKLTIAIPVYERKEFFEEALLSAINQTIKCKIMVVDNASSHNFFKNKCNEFGIDYFRNYTNIGMFPNWNRCINLSKSEYVLLLSDDDILDIEYVETFLKAITKYKEIDIFYSTFLNYDNSSKELSTMNHILPVGYFENGFEILKFGVLYKLGFPIGSAAIKKKKFTGFYEKFQASNDWVWIYSNAKKLSFYGEKNPLLIRRSHSSNDSKNIDVNINCFLSIAYIYGHILKSEFNQNKTLFQRANKNYLESILYFLSYANNKKITNILNQDNLYSNFLKKELKNNQLLKLYRNMPFRMRKLLFKVSRRIFFYG